MKKHVAKETYLWSLREDQIVNMVFKVIRHWKLLQLYIDLVASVCLIRYLIFAASQPMLLELQVVITA